MNKIVIFLVSIFCLSICGYSQIKIKFKGTEKSLIKSEMKWTLIEHNYRYLGQYIDAYSTYVQIKSDEQYYYIGQSQLYLDSLDEASKITKYSESDDEGFIFEENLPDQELNSKEQFFHNTNDAEESKHNLIRKQFVGYQNILRIPKKGGWVQKIGSKKIHQDSEGYSVDPNQDEWRNSFQVKLSLNK
jgi:hypothetical protein